MVLRRWLAGAALGAALAANPSARAGQPIRFSNPNREVEQPNRTNDYKNLPRPTLKFEFRNPEISAPFLPPPAPPDTRTQRKLRELREEQKNWLFSEPRLFKDKFLDPTRSEDQPELEGALSEWDSRVTRVFGPENAKAGENKSTAPAASSLYSDEPLFQRRQSQASRPDSSGDRHGPANSTEAAAKALFEPRESMGRLMLLPGMSLSEVIGTPEDLAAKRELQRQRDEFKALLAPPGQPPEGAGDLLGLGGDSTRTLLQPITPVPDATPSSLLKTLDGRPPTPENRLLRERSPEEASWSRRQAPLPLPAPADARSRQLESLRLNSRPSVLASPGRPF